MKHRWRLLATVAALALVATACAANGTGSGGSGAATGTGGASGTGGPATGTVLTIERTGGFAGVRDQITVQADGAWAAQDRTGKQRTGQLDPQLLAQLKRLLADPRLAGAAAQPSGPSKCADAFQYTLRAGDTKVSYVDCPADGDLPAAALEIIALVIPAVVG